MTKATSSISEQRLSLCAILDDDLVLTSTEDMQRYCTDWHGDVTSGAVAVIRPRSVADVQAAMKACRELGLAIVPQGGNTGLVLGGTPDEPDHQVVDIDET